MTGWLLVLCGIATFVWRYSGDTNAESWSDARVGGYALLLGLATLLLEWKFGLMRPALPGSFEQGGARVALELLAAVPLFLPPEGRLVNLPTLIPAVLYLVLVGISAAALRGGEKGDETNLKPRGHSQFGTEYDDWKASSWPCSLLRESAGSDARDACPTTHCRASCSRAVLAASRRW